MSAERQDTPAPAWAFEEGQLVRVGGTTHRILACLETPSGTEPRSYRVVPVRANGSRYGARERVFGESAVTAFSIERRPAAPPQDARRPPTDVVMLPSEALRGPRSEADVPTPSDSAAEAEGAQGAPQRPSRRKNAPFASDAVVRVVVEACPKREGTANHGRWIAGYPASGEERTVADCLRMGVTMGDIKYDVKHGFIVVTEPE